MIGRRCYMTNKTKKVAYFIGSLALVAPFAALAAGLDTSAGGGTGLPDSSLTDIVKSIMNWLLMMIGVFAVIGFAIAGVLYLTAAGNEKQVDRAKTAMTYSIVGVIVAIAGLVALKVANNILGSSTNF